MFRMHSDDVALHSAWGFVPIQYLLIILALSEIKVRHTQIFDWVYSQFFLPLAFPHSFDLTQAYTCQVPAYILMVFLSMLRS